MSGVASTSDLTRQPNFDATDPAPKKSKKTSKKKTSTASAAPAAPVARSLQYGFNEIAQDSLLSAYIEASRAKELKVFRDSSPMLRRLPFKSELLFSPDALPTALEKYEVECRGVWGYDKLKVRFPFRPVRRHGLS